MNKVSAALPTDPVDFFGYNSKKGIVFVDFKNGTYIIEQITPAEGQHIMQHGAKVVTPEWIQQFHKPFRKVAKMSIVAAQLKTIAKSVTAMAEKMPEGEAEQLMDYEKRGLGTRPFKLLGLYALPSKALAEQNPSAYSNLLSEMPRVSSGNIGICTRCGRDIIYNFIIQNGEGHTFPVGSECVLKHDMAYKVRQLLMDEKTKQKALKSRMFNDSIRKILTDKETAEKLDRIPHSNKFMADKGKTMRDWAQFVFDHAYTQSRKEQLMGEITKLLALAETPEYKNKAKQAPVADTWFVEKADMVKKVIALLGTDPYYEKWIDKLRNKEQIPPVIWDSFVRRVEHLKKNETSPDFPKDKTEFKDLVVHVGNLKFTRDVFNSGYHSTETSKLVLMGQIEGYREIAYIKIPLTTFCKKYDLNESMIELSQDDSRFDESFADSHEDAAKQEWAKLESKIRHRKVTMAGTFMSNGKMVFGSRVKIVSIA